MSHPRMTIVVTTIALPRVLESYAANAARFGHLDAVEALVVGDRKTPAESADYCQGLRRQWGFRAEYLAPAVQDTWLARFGDLGNLIPYNSDNRRNVGFLMALERDCDVLLSIDDDNYCTEEDFYEGHAAAGRAVQGTVVSSSTGWFNICEMLANDAGLTVFPRGFPVGWRAAPATITLESRDAFVAANAGLWVEDPDLDAVTRLYRDVKTTALVRESVLLGPAANSPINTQNTAVCRQAIPAYYYIVMGENLGGAKIDRYGDIWSGFFLKKCVDHLGHFCRIGRPLSRHVRNRHDLFVDLRQELYGMMLTEPLAEILASIKLQGDDYGPAYADLSQRIETAVAECEHPYLTRAVKTYFRKICSNMRTWVDACGALT